MNAELVETIRNCTFDYLSRRSSRGESSYIAMNRKNSFASRRENGSPQITTSIV
jgi:hypothetical protein